MRLIYRDHDSHLSAPYDGIMRLKYRDHDSHLSAPFDRITLLLFRDHDSKSRFASFFAKFALKCVK